MANEVGTASNLEDLVTKIIRFLTGYATFTAPAFTGTGNGVISGLDTYPAAVTETWTLTCTVAAANGGTFSVVGSVSGAKANATVGTAYDNALVKFLINDGTTDFLVGDVFTFTTTAGVMPVIQRWQVLRNRRDNIAAFTTSYLQAAAVPARTPLQTCRHDPRSINLDTLVNSSDGCYYTQTGNVNGTSYLQWQLRQAKEVASVRVKACQYTVFTGYTPQKFRLQYSDDGVAWTTALTQATSYTFAPGEVKTWAVPAVGAHLYWKFITDSTTTTGSSAYAAWESLLLLDAAGAEVNHFGSELILKATGNAGTDAIYMGLRSEYDDASGWYNLVLNGYTGYDPTASWFMQPGALPGDGASQKNYNPLVTCWNATMPYWFAADGRSFRFALKVSTSYESGYMGFILPYATPGQYPYPLAVGGSMTPTDTPRTTDWRYSAANERRGGPAAPGGTGPTSSAIQGTLQVRDPSGVWQAFANRQYSYGESLAGISQDTSPPYAINVNSSYRAVWPHCMNTQWGAGKLPYRECLGGGYLVQPCVLMEYMPQRLVLGELDGVYSISGYSNAPENTTVIGGKTYVVMQQNTRNTVHEFWALSLD